MTDREARDHHILHSNKVFPFLLYLCLLVILILIMLMVMRVPVISWWLTPVVWVNGLASALLGPYLVEGAWGWWIGWMPGWRP